MLTNQQKNELLQVLTKLQIPPTQFSKEDGSAEKFEIKVAGKPFHFCVTRNRSVTGMNPYNSDIWPSESMQQDAWGNEVGSDWKGIVRLFTDWAKDIGQDLQTPDLWAEAAKTAQLFAPTAEPSDDKFTRTELAEVQGQLRLLQLSFTHAALPEAAKQKLIELTKTAAVKAEGLTKKDWQNWIIGGFISAITGLALNPAQAGDVLKLVKAAFGGLFLH